MSGGVDDSLEIVKGWPEQEFTFIHVTHYEGRLATTSGTANLVCELVVWTPWRVAGRVHHDGG
jgi:hypothetical protein